MNLTASRILDSERHNGLISGNHKRSAAPCAIRRIDVTLGRICHINSKVEIFQSRDHPGEFLCLPCRIRHLDGHAIEGEAIIVISSEAYRERTVRIQKQFSRGESSPVPANRIGH